MKPEALEFLMELYKEGVARREAMEIVLEDLATTPTHWTKIAADQLRGLDDGSKDYAKSVVPEPSATMSDKLAARRSTAVLGKLPGNGFAKAAVDFYHPGLGAGVGAGLGALGGYMSYLGGRRRGDDPDWTGWAKNVLGGAAVGGVGGGVLSKGLKALHGPDSTGNAELDGYNYLRATNPGMDLPFVPRQDKLKSTVGANIADAGFGALAGGAQGAALRGNWLGAAGLQALRPFLNSGLEDNLGGLAGWFGNRFVDAGTGFVAGTPSKSAPPTVVGVRQVDTPYSTHTLRTSESMDPSKIRVDMRMSDGTYRKGLTGLEGIDALRQQKSSPKPGTRPSLDNLTAEQLMSDGISRKVTGLAAQQSLNTDRLLTARSRPKTVIGRAYEKMTRRQKWSILASLLSGLVLDSYGRPQARELGGWGEGLLGR